MPVPVPIPSGTFNRAYEAGKTTLVGSAIEWCSVPRVALLLAIAAVLYGWPTASRKLVKSGGAAVCQSKYCQPSEMWIDPPKQTLLKDQSLQTGLGRPARLPIPSDVDKKMRSDRVREQVQSPGVRLVAHAID